MKKRCCLKKHWVIALVRRPFTANSWTKVGKEQWEEARILLEKAVVINQEVGNEKGLAIVYGKLANCYEQQNNLPTALIYHKKEIELLEKFNSPGDLAFALKNLAAYIRMGRFDLAQDVLLRAESLERDLNRPDLVATIWYALGNLSGGVRRAGSN